MVFRSTCKLVLFLVVASLMFSGVALAQMLGSVSGTVTDVDGLTLPGVAITISGANLDRYTMTDENGRYRFVSVRAGEYTMTADMTTYSMIEKSGVRVQGGKKTVVDFTMMIIESEETVVVGQTEMVDKDQTDRTTFSEEILETLPIIGNDYTDIAKLSAGVRTNDDGELLINGARATSTKTTVDGVNTTDKFIGESWFQINTEALEEVQVESSAFDASSSGTAGGEVKMITKSGQNDTEFVLGLNYQSSMFDGNGASDYAVSTGEFDVYAPFFSAGGAIIKDKLWYFFTVSYVDASYPRVKLTDDGEAHSYNPTYSGLETGLFKLTYQLNPRNSLVFQYIGRYMTYEEFANSGRVAWVPSESDATQDQGYNAYSIKVDSTLTDNMNLESQFSIYNSFIKRNAVNPDAGIWMNVNNDIISGAYPFTFEYNSDSLALRENLVYYKDEWGGGDHEFKVGFELSRSHDDSRWNLSDSLEFPYRDYPLIGYAYQTYSQPTQTEINEVVFWAQDIWDFPDYNLTLQLGFNYRMERIHDLGITGVDARSPITGVVHGNNYAWCLDPQTLMDNTDPSYWAGNCKPLTASEYSEWGVEIASIPGKLGVHTDNEEFSYGSGNISPRLGLIWDIYGDDKTIVTFNAARNYDRLSFTASWETPLYETSALIWDKNGDGQITDYDMSSLSYNDVNYSIIDRDIETPYTDEWGGGIERELTDHLALKVRYINRHGEKQLQDYEINKMYDADGAIPEPYFDPILGWVDPSRKNKSANNIFYLTNGDTYTYESVQLTLEKRYNRNWGMIANYTYSKSKGTGESFRGTEGDDVRTAASQYGYLENDQRHVINIVTTNNLPGDVRLGTVISWESGLPYSDMYEFSQWPIFTSYFLGSKNQGRSPSRWRVDMNLQKDFIFGKNSLTVGMKVLNIFNEPYIQDQYHTTWDAFLSTGVGPFSVVHLQADYWDYDRAWGRQWEFNLRYKF